MFYNPNDPQSVEKYSSAVTLSDMEIFIFPEILYALTLANIMSPRPWMWREDSWFDKIDKMNPYKRLLRVKQYIMDHFTFNLDLDTWGLTTKDAELARFAAFIDETTLAQSNALFGYEGDKYYFDIDIRRHFGLDKYTTEVIPYWKTETIEAMEAFKHKENYTSGAGECVSLSTLYAASLFVLGKIPLEQIFLLATPLHSQNFIDVADGVLTNNRRIVTKSMWFNGTEISQKAQRAIINERITMVMNNTGYIHALYPEATINPTDLAHFTNRLNSYLTTDISFEILANFLRANPKLQKCFQFIHGCSGKPRYIEAEKVYHYEHSVKFKASDDTREQLLHEIDEDEYYTEAIPKRIVLDELEKFFKNHPISLDNIHELKSQLCHTCFNVEEVIADLITFCKTVPQLPQAADKTFTPLEKIALTPAMTRNEILEYLAGLRATHPIVDLAFMAYRDMRYAPWKPFIVAALERSPVSVAQSSELSLDQVYEKLSSMPAESIYDGSRMAQPDEVWNYNRGDGLEKALCFMNIARSKTGRESVLFSGEQGSIIISVEKKEYRFSSEKNCPYPTAEDFS